MERWSQLLGLSSTRLRNACRFALTARRTCLTFVSVAILFELFLPSFLFADEATLTERILALPFVSSDPAEPVVGFNAYDGTWNVQKDGSVATVGESGPRLTYADPRWARATEGVVEIDIKFPTAAPGFSGICFKISQSGRGADAFNGYEIGFNPAEKLINIGAHRQNYQQLKRYAYDVPVGKYFRLRIEFDEKGFVFYIDGERVGEYRNEAIAPDDPLRAGAFTLRNWQNDVEYRNLKARLLKSQDPTVAPDSELVDVPFLAAETPSGEYPETLETDDLPPFLYLARSTLTRPNSVGNDLWQAKPKRQGCAIRIVDPANPAKPIQTVFEDPEGSIYDMNLSFDAKTIFFSYRPKGFEYWNIWKIGVDGSNLTRLTSGPFFDVSPAELPDGGIVFVSTRRFGRTVCQPGPASNLFRMEADGSKIKCVSMNTLSDFNPQVLPDGRVLFTRWEYIDRDLTFRQSLWTQNPEGTVYQLYYGNTIREFGSVLQARPIPGEPASKVLATFAPHHGYPHGAIGVVDRSRGIEAGRGKGFVFWTKEFDVVQDISRDYAYRDPNPLDSERALCAFGSANVGVLGANSAGNDLRYRIWLLDCDGEKRLLAEEPELDCFCPIPLVETPRPPVQPTRIIDPNLRKTLRPQLKPRELFAGMRVTDGVEPTDPYRAFVESVNGKAGEAQASDAEDQCVVDDWGVPERTDLLLGDPVGLVTVADVYQGLEPAVKRGAVKRIRIMEQIRKTEELYDRAYDQSPSMGVGTYYAKRCWGEVPVDEDGSAKFYVPALREIYFQALDSEGREIQRMTSAAQFMPGESIGCLGCHEDRDSIPATAQESSRLPSAAFREPDVPALPEFIYDAYRDRAERGGNLALDAGVVDYPSLMQPVLDKYCVSCHDGADPAGGYDLSGDLTRFFSESYEAILLKSRSYRQEDMLTGETPEDQKALGKPLAQFHWLLFTPSAVSKPYATGTYASRLPEYFTKEHCGVEVDAKTMRRVYFWLDSNAIYQGTYAHSRPKSAGRRDRWAALDGSGMATWFEKDFLPAYNENCARCHQDILGGDRDLPGVHVAKNIDWIGRFSWLDLSRPEKSAALVAHLPKDQGGRGVSIDPNADPPKFIFTSKNDPLYKRFYEAISVGKADAEARPDADQPGFVSARPEP